MIEKITRVLHLIFALCCLGGIFWGAYFLIAKIAIFFLGLNSDVAQAIIAAVATFFAAVITLVYSKHYESREAERNRIKDKKIPIYEEWISFFMKLALQGKDGAKQKKMTEEDMQKFFIENTQKLMIWGSDQVVFEFSKWRLSLTNSSSESSNSPNSLLIFEELLYAIRKDLGHENKNLSQGTLLSLFINDINNFIENKTDAEQVRRRGK